MSEEQKKKSLIKEFSKVFGVRDTENKKEIKEEYRKGYMDPTNVCMVIPKKESCKMMLETMFDVEEKTVPDLSYHYDTKSELKYCCKYSTEYLRPILEICKHYERIWLSVKEEYPLTIETDDFIYIQAPFIDNED